jgi:hypothetical protein
VNLGSQAVPTPPRGPQTRAIKNLCSRAICGGSYAHAHPNHLPTLRPRRCHRRVASARADLLTMRARRADQERHAGEVADRRARRADRRTRRLGAPRSARHGRVIISRVKGVASPEPYQSNWGPLWHGVRRPLCGEHERNAANTMRGGRSSYRFSSSDPLTTPSISFGSAVPPNRPGS